jgi:hypothetical protein
MDKKQAQFLPFHAINEFMRNDYRLEIVRETLEKLPGLEADYYAPIERLTRKFVQVPGFRNSAKAPWQKRVRPTAEAFEKSPQLVAAILSAWCAAQPELRQQVYDLLIARGWEVLPAEADRTKLPGFIASWPKGEDFEKLNAAFTEKYPEAQVKNDDVSLMIVWLSTRLPFQTESDDEEQPEADSPGGISEGGPAKIQMDGIP